MNDLPTNAISMLRLMPSKTKEVATFSKQIIEAVQNGNANPLEVQVMLKALELLSKEVREHIEDYVVREADKYGEKKFNAFGAIVERCEVGTTYDYKYSKDSEWEQLDSEMKSLAARKAERETFLKSLKQPLVLVNQETGEVEEVRPPLKKSKSGVKVYLANV